MRAHCVLTALLALAALTTNTYSEEKHNAPQNSEREKQDPSALESAYRSSILEFSHVLPDLSVETITFRQFESNWRGPRSRVAFIINVGCPAERALIEIDTETSKVVGYVRYKPESVAEGASPEDVLTVQDAFLSALPVLQYYKLSTSITDYKTIRPRTTFGDLSYAEWVFTQESSFEGVPFRISGIVVVVTASSGMVRDVVFLPVIEPEPRHAEPISKETAIGSATQYLEDSPFFANRRTSFPCDLNTRIQAVIAFPNRNFDGAPPADGVDPSKAYYCWEIPFEWGTSAGEAQHKCVLWIAMDSGKFIGGDGAEHE